MNKSIIAAFLVTLVVASVRLVEAQQPTNFDLVINLKTAKQVSLTITPNVLSWADRVIK